MMAQLAASGSRAARLMIHSSICMVVILLVLFVLPGGVDQGRREDAPGTAKSQGDHRSQTGVKGGYHQITSLLRPKKRSNVVGPTNSRSLSGEM